MNTAFDQFVPGDDSDIEDLPPVATPDLPPGEKADNYDDGPPRYDNRRDDDDPFAGSEEADAPLPSQERDWEKEARRMGWRDPSETGRGVDAKSFVLSSRVEGEKLLTQVDDLTRSMRQMRDDQKRATMQARADGYRRALQAVRAEQQRARAEYDVEAMDRAYRQEMQIVSSAQQEVAEMRSQQVAAQREAANAPDPTWDSWVAENQWYDKDPELQALADSTGAVLAQQGLTGRALMDRVAEALKVARPDKFTNQRRRNAPVADSNSARGGESGAGLNSLPNEVRAAFSDFYDEHASEFKSRDHARKYFLDMMKG